MSSVHSRFANYLPWGDEPRRVAPGRGSDSSRQRRRPWAGLWRALLASMRGGGCATPAPAAVPPCATSASAEGPARRAGIWQAQLAHMLEATMQALPPAWRPSPAALTAAMQQLHTLRGVALSLVAWSPEAHRGCATPGFAAAARELCRLASGRARQAGGAALPALPALAVHRILELAARPWSAWLLAAVAAGEQAPPPAPLIAPRSLCSFCFAAAAEGIRLKRCARCR